MKKLLFVILVGAVCGLLLISGCGSFPTSYSKIENNRVRVLDFMFEPAEAAPGDTVTMKAVFAGKSIDLADIEWTVSYKVLTNNYGVARKLDSIPLDIINVAETGYSDRTQSWDITFVVPEWVIADNPAIPEDLVSMLPSDEMKDLIPNDMKIYFKKSYALPLLEALAEKAPSWKIALADGKRDSLFANDSLFAFYTVSGIGSFLPIVTQLFSIRSYIMTNVKTSHMIRSEFTVRYNKKLEGLPECNVFANNNPRIDSIGLYIVEEPDLVIYDPQKDTYRAEFMRLDRPEDDSSEPIIEVEKTNSYFLRAFTNAPDTVMTLTALFDSTADIQIEDYIYVWYFMLDSNEVENITYKKHMNVGNLGTGIAHLYPPTSKELKTFTIWLEVRDYALNERFRPVGSTLKEIRGKFHYNEN